MCSDLQEWARFVASVGFPVVAAGYLIVRIDRTLQKLSTELALVHNALRVLINKTVAR